MLTQEREALGNTFSYRHTIKHTDDGTGFRVRAQTPKINLLKLAKSKMPQYTDLPTKRGLVKPFNHLNPLTPQVEKLPGLPGRKNINTGLLQQLDCSPKRVEEATNQILAD